MVVEQKQLPIQVDDTVKHIIGDSLAKVIFEADEVKLLALSVQAPQANDSAIVNDSTRLDSITPPDFHGCYIAKDFGALSKPEVAPLLFILADRDAYFLGDARLKSPFMPEVALTFKKENAKVDIIFSFTGGQLYIFQENEEKIYFKYNYERLILRYFQSFLQEERIEEFLSL